LTLAGWCPESKRAAEAALAGRWHPGEPTPDERLDHGLIKA
jgi:hypothetical protein